MTTNAIESAALALAEARINGRTVVLPQGSAPRTTADAYAIQARLHELLSGRGEGPIAGHKIGCTTKVMREKLGVDEPCAGRIRAARLVANGGQWSVSDRVRPSVECEIAVRLGADLPVSSRPYDAARLRQAISACMASIELCDNRYVEGAGVPIQTADDFYNVGCALGREISDWQALDLAALAGAMRINGEEIGRGRGADIMGHPLNALAWLADLRAREGRALRAGEFVTLGSVTRSCPVGAGDRVEIEFEGLGGVTLNIV